MIYRFLTRGGTAAALAALNEVPKAREQIVETDTLRFKLGDGVTPYNSLPYVTDVDDAIADGEAVRAPSQNAVFDALALKAPLASPAFTGNPTAPTPAPGDNDTSVATTAFVAAAVAAGGGGGSASAGWQIGYARTVSTTTASTTSAIPIDASIPQNTEGAAYSALDTSYTPTASTSLLEIEVIIPFVSLSVVGGVIGALFEGSTANAIAATDIVLAAGDFVLPMILRAVVSAGSTSARTYSFRFGRSGGSGTAYLLAASGVNYFGASNVATLTVREIKQ